MAIADDIPVRSNGGTIIAAWFNTIRTVLLSITGTESVSQTSFSGLASQTGANVTGLAFDNTATRRADVKYTIVTATKVESGNFVLLYDGSDWTMYAGAVHGVDSGITLDVNAASGQVEYDSGGETFTMNFKAETFDV